MPHDDMFFDGAPADAGEAPARSSRVRVDGLTLNVVEWGAPEAPPLVLLHGLREAARTFGPIADALAHGGGRGRRLVALDQRGRGASDWDPARRYDTGTYVADLCAVADALGLTTFDLLGHSMGGAVAIVFAARHPERVRRLVVEDVGPGAFESSPTAARLREQLAAAPLAFGSREEALDDLRRMKPGQSAAQLRQRWQGMLRPDGKGQWVWRHDHAGIAATRLAPDPARAVDLRSHVQQLRCPTLVLRGADSDYLLPASARAMVADNPRIVCEEIAGAGHYVHEDAPGAFTAAVSRFLQDADAATDPHHEEEPSR